MTLLSAASILVGLVNVGMSIQNAYTIEWKHCSKRAINILTGLSSLLWVAISLVSFDFGNIYHFTVSHVQEFGHLMAAAYMTVILSFLKQHGGEQQ